MIEKLKIKNKISKTQIKYKKFSFIFFICVFYFLSLIFSFNAFAEERLFEIKAKKFVYTPNIIKVNKGDLVRIRLISEDVTHGLFVDGYGVETSAHPGQDGSVEFVANRTGRFSYRCSVTCGEFHPYMIGYLIVEPNLRFYIYVALIVLVAVGFLLFTKSKAKQADSPNSA